MDPSPRKRSFRRFDPAGYFKGAIHSRGGRVFANEQRLRSSFSFFFFTAPGLPLIVFEDGSLVAASLRKRRRCQASFLSKVFLWVTRRASRNKFLPSASEEGRFPALNHGNGLFNRRETTTLG